MGQEEGKKGNDAPAVGDWITVGPTDGPVERVEGGMVHVDGEWWDEAQAAGCFK